MKLRLSKAMPVAAAQAGISVATAYRIEHDPRLPSDKKTPRARRRPDPLVDFFEAEVVPFCSALPAFGLWRYSTSCGGAIRTSHPAFVERSSGGFAPGGR